MLGKRLWLDVEHLSLSDHSSKKFAAGSDSDAPKSKSSPHARNIDSPACRNCSVSAVNALPCSPLTDSSPSQRANQVRMPQEPRLDPIYRKELLKYVQQPTGHGVLPERVALKDMVQICHSAWNREYDPPEL